MTERYSVRVTKDYLVFCAGHFITYNGTECECLHGHNYRAAVELAGPLDANHYVFDFIALKKILRAVVNELDHRMLVATQNKLMTVDEVGRNVRVRFRDKEWSFPREDCKLLPIENTTAELLAKWIAGRLRSELKSQHGLEPSAVRVEVEESFGQTARYDWQA